MSMLDLKLWRDMWRAKGQVVTIALVVASGVAAFCAALSTDFFGDRLAEALERSKVSLKYVVRAPRSSMLAFVSMGDGEPEYAFIDDASAGRLFSPERDAPPIGDEVSMIWTGSVALINDPIASAYEKLYFDNKGKRVLGMDPNVRPTVVTDAAAYRAYDEDAAHNELRARLSPFVDQIARAQLEIPEL